MLDLFFNVERFKRALNKNGLLIVLEKSFSQ